MSISKGPDLFFVAKKFGDLLRRIFSTEI